MINGRAGNVVVDIANNYRARRVVGAASIKRFYIAAIRPRLRCDSMRASKRRVLHLFSRRYILVLRRPRGIVLSITAGARPYRIPRFLVATTDSFPERPL